MNSHANLRSFLLPKLKDDTDLRLEESGEWKSLSLEAFQKVANSLDVKSAPQDVKQVSSIPDIWARPQSLEMAIYLEDYPIRQQMIEQWRGMLAAIAFAENKEFPLQVRALDLEQEETVLSHALRALPPSTKHKLYALDQNNPWFSLYLFFWNGSPVGMTSPSTLVCPSEAGNWTGLPWWQGDRLQSPIRFLNAKEKLDLQIWLQHLCNEVTDQNGIHRGNQVAKNILLKCLHEFQADLDKDASQNLAGLDPRQVEARLSSNPRYFGEELTLGVLRALSRPLKSGKTPDHLFLPELFFIDYEEGSLPGCFLPPGATDLTYNGKKIFPLIPVKASFFEGLSLNDGDRNYPIQFEQIRTSHETTIRVTVRRPLTTSAGSTGTTGSTNPGSGNTSSGNTRQPSIETHFYDYTLQDKNCIPGKVLPILEIWPYFQAEDWQEYYSFYFDRSYGDRTFAVDFLNPRLKHPFNEGNETYQICKLDQFPTFATCSKNQTPIGQVLFQPPPKIQQTTPADWQVGVDFGTSFTNVYVNENDQVMPLTLHPLHLSVMSDDATARRSLFEYFIPNTFIPEEKPLPFASVLTHRQKMHPINQAALPILDGRMYIPEDSDGFDPKERYFQTNLKWSTNREFSELLFKHLALHITALAKRERVRKISWSLSFPSAFSHNDKEAYLSTWRRISQALHQTTGIEFDAPERQDDRFCTESLAIAYYFSYRERNAPVRTTYIDIGGGTSDISIWENGKPIHQCSIRLAGQHLFAQFIQFNQGFLTRHLKIQASHLSKWQGLADPKIWTKIDIWLRQNSKNWLHQEMRSAIHQPEFQQLQQLMAIGFSGLYYYVGILLRALASQAEPKYTQKEITEVYLGGNGSQFLHWLCPEGQYRPESTKINQVLSELLKRGAQFDQAIRRDTKISQAPKDEVACGLVVPKRFRANPMNACLIAGEKYKINGIDFEWNSILDLKEEIESFSIDPEMALLRDFMRQFQAVLKELDIEEINGQIPGYSPNISEESKRLWQDVQDQVVTLILELQNSSNSIKDTRLEPPFILGLKALLIVLGRRWAERWRG